MTALPLTRCGADMVREYSPNDPDQRPGDEQ